ncbi:molybdenum cofactor biosynthesis protein MoaE [Geomicrobium sp. JCM 19055]|uniref:molybdenum cofactor biosynthesis protein MoaE n=1 Tax=Geomicrobium sp. JCM 19055 TaxID=1460649 RepID=UPI00045ECE37|nr:molybdenum cofactor biosynthesis protein MoaE [Geomicrobium sp. JCM 19055]GAK00490.1 molybdenum cofactor biosynthesis protein MoaE [Geomicrobium sp. JCM 19055]
MFKITYEPIAVNELIEHVLHNNVGAIQTFIGTVREMTHGKQTLRLEYHAYESMAVKMLERIGKEIEGKWPGTTVAITHRLGTLAIQEIAVVIAVSSPHRQASHEATSYAIERIKEVVPIWKKEYWADGSFWVGDQLEQNAYHEKEGHHG